MKNRLVAVLVAILLAGSLVSCDEASRVSHNISKEADNFNVERKIKKRKLDVIKRSGNSRATT